MRLILEPGRRRISTHATRSLLHALQGARIPIESVCGGKGTCGKCRVRVLEGARPPTESSKRHLTQKDIGGGIRLACQLKVEGDMRVEVPGESHSSRQEILTEGVRPLVPPKSNVRKYHLVLDAPTLQDTRSTLSRILDRMGNARIDEVDLEAIQSLSRISRNEIPSLTAVVIGGSVVDFEAGDTTGKKYGVAADIGTTTLVAYLADLTTGKMLAASSMLNPQTAYGEDVISRIQYASTREGFARLHTSIVEAFAGLIRELAGKGGVEESHIYEMTVVGNTTMHHLFCGVSPATLASSPYVPSVTQQLDVRIPGIPARRICLLAPVAGFLGSDTVACLTASPLARRVRLTLDIGTNCEIVLGTRDRVLACSAAAGPAFEGAHITCGMRAAPGAVTEVHLEGDVDVTTTDGSPPRGIAGSGLISACAAMLEEGVMTVHGRIVRGHEYEGRVAGEGRSREFVLVEESQNQRKIAITQKDIREMQLAKAALFAAQRICAKEYGCVFEDIQEVELAGAFGTFLPIDAAQTIGMMPDMPPHKVRNIGNAAGMGAFVSLISTRERERASLTAKKIRYIELAGRRDFQEEFVDAMVFPHANLELFPAVSKRLNLD